MAISDNPFYSPIYVFTYFHYTITSPKHPPFSPFCITSSSTTTNLSLHFQPCITPPLCSLDLCSATPFPSLPFPPSMAAPNHPPSSSSSSSLPSLPPPLPKSPPQYPDLYGKRRQTAKLQMLDREIGFLEEELKSTEGLQPASRCCKEVADYVVAKSDPLIPTYKKHGRRCRFWKWLCGFPCCKLSWICCCCYAGCSIHLEIPPCCTCNNPCKSLSCGSCKIPKWWKCFGQCCCTCPTLPRCSCSCPTISCSECCCSWSLPSCPECPCCECKCRCKCSLGKCPKITPCCCFGGCSRRSCCSGSGCCNGNWCCCNPCHLCC